MDPELRAALVEEAGKKSSVLWLTYDGSERPRPAWHVWSEGAALVVGALTNKSSDKSTDKVEGTDKGEEQQLPGLENAKQANVTCRAKDTEARLVTWQGDVERLDPGSPEWEAAFLALRGERLNARDVSSLRERWLAEVFVVRIKPTQEYVEYPGNMSADEHSAPPPDTPASTRGKLPWVLHRRARKIRRLF